MAPVHVLQLDGEQIKLAIQKEGRLTEATLQLLRTAGLQFESAKQRLFSVCRNFPLAILYVRDDDIPEYVADGVADLGIVGQNLVQETERPVEELLPLNYGHCALMVAVPRESQIQSVEQLAGCKIATSYPVTTRRFFLERGINVDITTISGSVELAPTLGVSSAIVDLVSSGSSLKLNDLIPLEQVLQSQAALIANGDVFKDEQKSLFTNRLLMRLKGVLNARSYKYIMMNAPREALPAIVDLSSGMRSPTVLPTADAEWISVHIAVAEDTFWESIEQLRELGAQGILVSPIEKLFL
jgi:ATP phosphoribosyltransferase